MFFLTSPAASPVLSRFSQAINVLIYQNALLPVSRRLNLQNRVVTADRVASRVGIDPDKESLA
jgi:hypothetical protein